MAKKGTFTAAAMFKEIAAKGSPLSVVGVVKPSAADAGAISFAMHPVRSPWVDIPEGSVEGFEHLSTVQSAAGTFPLVRLNLKRPAPDGEVVADLLAMHQATSPPPQSDESASAPLPTSCYFDVGLGRWVCP